MNLYEQKYNEILEWARKNKARLNEVPIEEVLPELAESEDERIRKEMIETIRCISSDCQFAIFLSEQQKQRYLAYLEKQKEQKPWKVGANAYFTPEQKPSESISQLTVQGKGVYKICPRCKERMVRDDSMVYTSMPPQYRYECPKCGESECDTVMYDNPEMEEQKPTEKHDLVAQLKEHLANTPKEQLEAEWKELEHWNNIGPTVEEYFGSIKPAEWSEEDERNIRNLESVLYYDKYLSDETRTELGNFLKSLPERFNLQPKQEWSEEDEETIRDAINRIEQLDHYWNRPRDEKLIKRLKSLRPSWKPSEEQMKALIDCTIGNEYDVHALVRLWAELKKL